jgi:hypothetical protein
LIFFLCIIILSLSKSSHLDFANSSAYNSYALGFSNIKSGLNFSICYFLEYNPIPLFIYLLAAKLSFNPAFFKFITDYSFFQNGVYKQSFDYIIYSNSDDVRVFIRIEKPKNDAAPKPAVPA